MNQSYNAVSLSTSPSVIWHTWIYHTMQFHCLPARLSSDIHESIIQCSFTVYQPVCHLTYMNQPHVLFHCLSSALHNNSFLLNTFKCKLKAHVFGRWHSSSGATVLYLCLNFITSYIIFPSYFIFIFIFNFLHITTEYADWETQQITYWCHY